VVGRPEEQLELEAGATLGRLFEDYGARFPRMREMAGRILLARNREFSEAAAAIQDGDEIAFLPPVSGGRQYLHEVSENGHFFALTRQPINTRKIAERLLEAENGAIVTFEGVARNNTNGRRTHYLDYECYEPMAMKVMARIGAQIAADYAIRRIAMVHRLGRLLIGETSVVVMVSAPHRQAAFAAVQAGIDQLKRQVPIWKKEHFADGEVWVEGEWDRHASRAQGG